MIQVRPLEPLLFVPSSPRMESAGKWRRSEATIAASLSRSARETQSLRAFMSASALPSCSQCFNKTAAPSFAASDAASMSSTPRHSIRDGSLRVQRELIDDETGLIGTVFDADEIDLNRLHFVRSEIE